MGGFKFLGFRVEPKTWGFQVPFLLFSPNKALEATRFGPLNFNWCTKTTKTWIIKDGSTNQPFKEDAIVASQLRSHRTMIIQQHIDNEFPFSKIYQTVVTFIPNTSVPLVKAIVLTPEAVSYTVHCSPESDRTTCVWDLNHRHGDHRPTYKPCPVNEGSK